MKETNKTACQRKNTHNVILNRIKHIPLLMLFIKALRSIKNNGWRITWAKVKRKLIQEKIDVPKIDYSVIKKNREPNLSANQIIEIIKRDDIQLVSFDLFDTLLARPSLFPKDIYTLLQSTVKTEYGLNFWKLRYSAEDELNNEFATLGEIWEYIAKKNHLDSKTAHALREKEMKLERDMLTVRRDTKLLYDAAVSCGKRIVVVSDMYLPSDFLLAVIKEKGFDRVSAVYVSCEHKMRKSNGKLYEFVLKQERISSPAEMLHIGDDEASDYKAALEQGITAVYYPSVWDLTMASDSPWGNVFRVVGLSAVPAKRILLSFAFLNSWNKSDNMLYGEHCFASLEQFSDLFLAPMLTELAIELLSNNEIQNGYSALLFAARDGFLPQKIYEILGKNRKHIFGKYLYVSRQALSYASYHSFEDYFKQTKWVGDTYRLKDYLDMYIVTQETRDAILKKLTEEECELNLCDPSFDPWSILNRYSEELEQYYSEQKELSKAYYKATIAQTGGRQIIFDCGYNGSVSVGLQRATDLPVDKYYLWETADNRRRDRYNHTKTVCFFKGEVFHGLNILFEECFSPLAGTCRGFEMCDGTPRPVLEALNVSDEMRRAMNTLESCCTKFAEEFEKTFCDYLSDMRSSDHNYYFAVARAVLVDSPYDELSVFQPIRFPDSYGPKKSLAKKISGIFTECALYRDSFSGTGFINPDTVLHLKDLVPKPTTGYRIGIHIHLYNKHLSEEILGYLKTITYPFDLYITVTDKAFEAVVYRLFNSSTIPYLQKMKVLLSENRGRDIAPWLIETRSFQHQYDLFCHIHSKESLQYGPGFGTKWRHYLYDNLLDGEAMADILSFFQADEKLGIVFPPCFSGIVDIHNSSKIPLQGEFGEEKMITELLRKMGFKDDFSRDELLFSAGTMMWYRPEALDLLFASNLKYDDFPEEPIGVGGTLAHAMERMPSIIARRCGYHTMQYNSYPEKESLPVSVRNYPVQKKKL